MFTHYLSEESSINWSYLKFEISLKTGNDPSTNLIGNIMRLQVWQTSPLHLGQRNRSVDLGHRSGSIAQEHVFWYIKTFKNPSYNTQDVWNCMDVYHFQKEKSWKSWTVRDIWCIPGWICWCLICMVAAHVYIYIHIIQHIYIIQYTFAC